MSKNDIPYWQQRRDLKLKGAPTATEKKESGKQKADFFKVMLANAPAKCMETGKPLNPKVNRMENIAHILAKSKTNGVPSMAEDPRNIVYLDGDVHTDMDRQGCDYMRKMKIFPLLRERVAKMWPDIPQSERRRVPFCLKPSE